MKKLLLFILIIATLFLTGCNIKVVEREEYEDEVAVVVNKKYTAARTVIMTQPYTIGKTVGIRSYPVSYPEDYDITIRARGMTKTYDATKETYEALEINDEIKIQILIKYYKDGTSSQEIVW